MLGYIVISTCVRLCVLILDSHGAYREVRTYSACLDESQRDHSKLLFLSFPLHPVVLTFVLKLNEKMSYSVLS